MCCKSSSRKYRKRDFRKCMSPSLDARLESSRGDSEKTLIYLKYSMSQLLKIHSTYKSLENVSQVRFQKSNLLWVANLSHQNHSDSLLSCLRFLGLRHSRRRGFYSGMRSLLVAFILLSLVLHAFWLGNSHTQDSSSSLRCSLPPSFFLHSGIGFATAFLLVSCKIGSLPLAISLFPSLGFRFLSNFIFLLLFLANHQFSG